jgi:hypothetical protein
MTGLCARFISYRPLAEVLPVTRCGNRAPLMRLLPPEHCAAAPDLSRRKGARPSRQPHGATQAQHLAQRQPTRLDTEPASHARAAPAQRLAAQPAPAPIRNPAQFTAPRPAARWQNPDLLAASKAITCWLQLPARASPPRHRVTGRRCPSICPSVAREFIGSVFEFMLTTWSGAMGIRTPDLLHAMRASSVRAGRITSGTRRSGRLVCLGRAGRADGGLGA